MKDLGGGRVKRGGHGGRAISIRGRLVLAGNPADKLECSARQCAGQSLLAYAEQRPDQQRRRSVTEKISAIQAANIHNDHLAGQDQRKRERNESGENQANGWLDHIDLRRSEITKGDLWPP